MYALENKQPQGLYLIFFFSFS